MNDSLLAQTFNTEEDAFDIDSFVRNRGARNSVARKSFDGRGSITDSLNVNLTEEIKENEKESNEVVKVNTMPIKKEKIYEEESDDELVGPKEIDGWNPTNYMERDPTLDHRDTALATNNVDAMGHNVNECFQ